MIISVAGTSGVGKSFLVKQLSSMMQWPAFFEGEEGTIPDNILENIFRDEDPLERWRFFLERYKNNFDKANLISKNLNLNCVIDGSLLNAKAILNYEKKHYQPKLKRLIEVKYNNLKSDFIIILKANEDCLTKFIEERARKSEKAKKALERSIKIQQNFIKIAENEKSVLIIDRSNLDFNNYKDLNFILNKIPHEN